MTAVPIHHACPFKEKANTNHFQFSVTRVEDTNTTSEAQALGPEISTLSSPRLETRSCPGIEERLRNIETHLGYRPGIPRPML